MARSWDSFGSPPPPFNRAENDTNWSAPLWLWVFKFAPAGYLRGRQKKALSDTLRCKIPDNCMKVKEIWGHEIHSTNTANGKPVLEITGRVGVTGEYLGTKRGRYAVQAHL